MAGRQREGSILMHFLFMFSFYISEGSFPVSEISCKQFKTHVQVSSVVPEIVP